VKLINFLLPGSRSRVAACLLVIAFSANAQQGRQDFSKVEIKIIAFGPGHTDGDAAVYFTNSKVLHLGDQFVTGRFPYVDVANEWW
jgi:glyoxylase-like metal-dependent hydrolase (beta-lactamase superfamily II)